MFRCSKFSRRSRDAQARSRASTKLRKRLGTRLGRVAGARPQTDRSGPWHTRTHKGHFASPAGLAPEIGSVRVSSVSPSKLVELHFLIISKMKPSILSQLFNIESTLAEAHLLSTLPVLMKHLISEQIEPSRAAPGSCRG
jgi:hypothetical protein